MLRTNIVFCCRRNEIIARLKEDVGYETRLPLTGPIKTGASKQIHYTVCCSATIPSLLLPLNRPPLTKLFFRHIAIYAQYRLQRC